MATPVWQALPPEEAIAYFRAKGLALGFSWRDVWAEEHDIAFTVAKAMSLDLLEEIRAGIDAALAEGQTLEQFRKALTPVLIARGWWGRREVIDPLTGEVREAQLGSARRLQTIFDTNLRTAYAAGHWRQIEETKEARPWLVYRHTPQEDPREEHQAWDGLCLPADDPWWRTHYPPNGWYCKCYVQQMNDRDLKRYGITPEAKAPPLMPRPWVDKRNNRVVVVPYGIDPGFDRNPGLTDRPAEARQRLAEKARVLEKNLGLPPGSLEAALPRQA